MTVHRRVSGTWSAETLEGLDTVITLPAIDAQLTQSELYEGVAFSPKTA